MPKSFNSRPKRLLMTSLIKKNIMILNALIMHDDYDIDQRFYKIFWPTYPNFFGHVTGNRHTFLFGLINKHSNAWNQFYNFPSFHWSYQNIHDIWRIHKIYYTVSCLYQVLLHVLYMHVTVSCPKHEGSGGGRVVKLLACGARGPKFDSRPRHLNFRDWLSPASKLSYGWNTAIAT